MGDRALFEDNYQAMALLANVRLGWKGFTVFSYFTFLSMATIKVIKLSISVNIEHFFFINDEAPSKTFQPCLILKGIYQALVLLTNVRLGWKG